MIHLKIWWLSSIAEVHTYLGFPIVGICYIYHFCDFKSNTLYSSKPLQELKQPTCDTSAP